MFQLKGCRLMPVLLLLFSWFGQECECPEAGCAKGGGAASGNKPRLSSVFEWIRVRVAPCAVRRGGGNGFARPAGQPGCRCPGLRTALASQAGKARPNYYSSPVCVHPVQARLNACPRPAGACIIFPRAAPQSMRPREPREPDTAEDAGGQTDHLGQAL